MIVLILRWKDALKEKKPVLSLKYAKRERRQRTNQFVIESNVTIQPKLCSYEVESGSALQCWPLHPSPGNTNTLNYSSSLAHPSPNP